MTFQSALALAGLLLVVAVVVYSKWTDISALFKRSGDSLSNTNHGPLSEQGNDLEAIPDINFESNFDSEQSPLYELQPENLAQNPPVLAPALEPDSKPADYTEQTLDHEAAVEGLHAEELVAEPKAAIADEIIDSSPKPIAPSQAAPVENHGVYQTLKQVDYWVKLSAHHACDASVLRTQLQALFECGIEVQMHALQLPKMQWQAFEDMADNSQYKDVVLSLPLLQNGHVVSPQQLQTLDTTVQKIARSHGFSTDALSTIDEAAEQATRLAQFKNDYIGQVKVFVQADEEGFSESLLLAAARSMGLQLDNGVFLRHKTVKEGVVNLYRLRRADGREFSGEASANPDYINTVVFEFTPALVQAPSRVVREFVDSIKAFNAKVKGRVLVPGYPDFHPDQLNALVEQVKQLEVEMLAVNLHAGSEEAVKIFG